MSTFVKRCSVAAVLAIAALLPQAQLVKVSDAGLALIADAEGCRLAPYQDCGGIWTNGIGHTGGVNSRSFIDEKLAALNFLWDVMLTERGVAACLLVTLPQQIYDAAISLAFNIGVGNFCNSTMVRLLNRGEWRNACLQLPRWIYVKKVRNQGLENRRGREMAWCLKGVA